MKCKAKQSPKRQSRERPATKGFRKECVMKRCMTILGLVVLALAGIGCERKEQADQPVAYDPELDGAFPSLPAPSVDPDFAALRAAIAEKAAIDTPPADPIEEAKRLVANLFAAAKKGDDDALIALLDEEEAATSRRLSSIAKNLPCKASWAWRCPRRQERGYSPGPAWAERTC